jgi:nucleoside-diphosphate-sugar epimerase
MSILMTGATSFLGRHLLVEFNRRGDRVHALARTPSALASLGVDPDKVVGHLFDGTYRSVAAAFEQARPSFVVHLASHFLAEHTSEDIASLIDGNVKFGCFVAEAASVNGCSSFINSNTYWQHYGAQDYCPANLYAATKRAFADMLRYYSEVRGIAIVDLVLYDIYGPGDGRNKLLPNLIDCLNSGSSLRLSPGYQRLDMVYVDDVVSAVVCAMELSATTNPRFQSYVVSSGHHITVRALVRRLEIVSGRRLEAQFGALPYRGRQIMVPWSRGARLPGWRPKVPIDDGLRRTLAARSSRSSHEEH